jgi:hypothetical protein
MLQVLDQWMHWRRNALETSKHQWQEQGVKKAVCTLEDRRQSSAIEWEDGAYSIISFCSIMSVSTCFSLVGNLAHNVTRLSLSNESFLLIKSCVFLCSWCTFMQITYWAHLCTHKTTAPRILWCFSFFFSLQKKTSMTPCFHKEFWEIKVLIQKQNQIGVCSNKQVLKIQVIS